LVFLLSIRIDENLCSISTATRVAGGTPKLAWAAWFASARPRRKNDYHPDFAFRKGKTAGFAISSLEARTPH
jgi:hypothetical protein